MQDRPDYYVILGVEPTASLQVIREAYRVRVQILHPDRFDRSRSPSAWKQANAMLLELNEAFAVLSDPSRRRAYDADFVRATGPDETKSTQRSDRQPPAGTGRGASRAAPSRAQRQPRGNPSSGLRLLVLGGVVVWLALYVSTPYEVPSSAPTRAQPSVDVDETADPLGGYTPDRPSQSDPGGAQGCDTGVDTSALPANGRVWRLDRRDPLAPLEVRVRGDRHYLVKVEQGGVAVAFMFVRAGSSAEMLVPLGDYSLKYATGSGQYWCGSDAQRPFGQQTLFFRADEVFSFRDIGSQYSGYTVELFLQPDGNLSTTALSPSQW